ncbi:MAG: MBL fold metallo-hydrolase [Pseudomonadales bacterium]|nr:MBL fold metallo-hydrolase [Pseudomonadales bacterium]MCP5345064.1 MBL fold metallo-hydrolase [Pseudomonadales bacterium]
MHLSKHIRSFLPYSALSLGLVFSTTVSAQTDYSQVQIIPHHVRGSMYYLEGAGGNIGLSVGEDGVVMIDDQFAPLTDKILTAVHSLNDGDIRFLINTHVHPDHTGGNENLGKQGIVILARDKVRVRLQANSPKDALPILTFTDDISIHLNGEELLVMPVPPAHTDGDSFIYFSESDVLHTGDAFRTTGYPYIDLANGGTLQGTLDALAIAIGMSGPDTIIVPGHGVPSSRADVIAFRDMTLEIMSIVKPMVERGMSYEQVEAAKPTAKYDTQFGNPNRFLPGVYVGLGGQL